MDKRQLYLQVLEEYQRRSVDDIVKLLQFHSSPRHAIEAMMLATIAAASSDEESKGCFMVNASVEEAAYDKEIQQLSQKNKDRLTGIFVDLIRKGQRSGDISKRFPATYLAEFIYTINNGIQVIGKYDKDIRKLRQTVQLTLSLLDD